MKIKTTLPAYPALTWMRAVRADNIAARRKVWRTTCGRYRVDESRSLFGLPTVYRAMRLVRLTDCFDAAALPREVWQVISTHKSRARAAAACEQCERANNGRREKAATLRNLRRAK